MNHKSKVIVAIMLIVLFLADSNMTMAKSNNTVIFKDKNLQNALIEYYELNYDIITKEKASELSEQWYNALVIKDSNITDLEGLQYFDNLVTLYLGGNSLKDLKQLSKLSKLAMLEISKNSLKGIILEKALSDVGKLKKLDVLILEDDRLTNIGFLDKIGNIYNYTNLEMPENYIRDISILEDATKLEMLDLSNNRITEVSPLKDLENLTFYLDLRDNCIIDYKPIKHLLDEMHSDPGNETGLERYDYYTNPVNIEYNGETIKFPYLTAYYKYQPYAEAIPLFKALGGSAVYIKHMGILVCRYKGNVLAMADFSDRYILNGEVKSMDYPMRRMQYDLAYVPVEDICKALGLNYNVTKEREIYYNDDEYFYVPKYVKISTD